MDPYIDEKIILATSAVISELFNEAFNLDCTREAYGPTINHGLCYEYCSRIDINGDDIKITFFLGLDGYTRLLLLPYLSERYSDIASKSDIFNLNDAIFFEFSKNIFLLIKNEIVDFFHNLEEKTVDICSHKLIPLSTEKFRKYMTIFFLRDSIKNIYLGRLYFVIAIHK